MTSVLDIGILEQHKALRESQIPDSNIQCDLYLKKFQDLCLMGELIFFATNIIKTFSLCSRHVSCLARHTSLVLY